MCGFTEIEAGIRGSSELRQRIVRDIGSFTVALFASFASPNGDRLELAGTGTLFAVGDSQFILTAAHVWEKVLKSATKVGITLDENISHSFWIDVSTIVPFGPPKPAAWNEWGPDIILLRVPAVRAATINAYKVFYDPIVDGKRPKVDVLETAVLMGTPHEFGTFARMHADVQISGRFVDSRTPIEIRGEWDYFNVQVDASSPDVPRSFGGFSGGGLWRVSAYCSPPTQQIDWARTFEGVAFYQSDVTNGLRIIGCHGPQSINAAISSIP